MRKSILFSLLLITTLVITGCSSKTSNTVATPKTYSSSASTDSSTVFTPLALGDITIYSSPFVINGTSLIFPNWEDNNKISIINEPYPKT